jgi:hypothetical protein
LLFFCVSWSFGPLGFGRLDVVHAFDFFFVAEIDEFLDGGEVAISIVVGEEAEAEDLGC